MGKVSLGLGRLQAGCCVSDQSRRGEGMRRLKVSTFDEIWREWKAGAAEGRRKASAEAVAVTRNIFDTAAGKKREGVSNDDLRKAVERLKQP